MATEWSVEARVSSTEPFQLVEQGGLAHAGAANEQRCTLALAPGRLILHPSLELVLFGRARNK
jgi:hypothetical protein